MAEMNNLSAVTVGELRDGIAAMLIRRRHDEYTDWLENHILPASARRVLAYDIEATAHYAT
ncbi:hypothetical protein ACWZHB_02705 [Nocardia sp. FBN12]|uniref:hypothetical protein n=1 Tax=Nocardia sp. FBN12 TaxID=3419766 RepID=UPI003D0129E0